MNPQLLVVVPLLALAAELQRAHPDHARLPGETYLP